MQKHLIAIGFMGFSSMAFAVNMTAITIGNVSAPVHVGVFRGMCSHLDMGQLKRPGDFPLIEGKSCEFITDQTLNPKQHNKTLNTWHQASVPLFAVAFQDGQPPIKCLIDDGDKLYVIEGPDGLVCSKTLNIISDDEETDTEITEPYSAKDGADIHVNVPPVEHVPAQDAAKAAPAVEVDAYGENRDMDQGAEDEPMEEKPILKKY